MDNMTVPADFEYQRMRSIARLAAIGIELTPPDDNDIVTIQQKELHNGRIRTNKELHQLARHLYPDKRYKIRPVTFALNLDIVTPEWIRERMEALNIHSKDLVQQLGITSSEISVFVNGKRPMSRSMRSMFYYYFLTFELNSRVRLDVTAQDLSEALDIIRERKNSELATLEER